MYVCLQWIHFNAVIASILTALRGKPLEKLSLPIAFNYYVDIKADRDLQREKLDYPVENGMISLSLRDFNYT